MSASQKLVSFVVFASFIVVVTLPLVHSSSPNATRPESNHKIQKLSPELSSEVILHGFLLWASMGFLMPIGILVIKMSNGEQCGRRLKVLFYFHVIIQVLSVLLATAGAILSIKNFENTFNNNHQRIGLGLYGIIWVQALIGFFRPKRGSNQRSMWFFVHWLSGTVITILGIMNIYTGLQAYHKRTSKSVRLWSILFSAEVCFIVFIYLLQDRWDYMKKQGVNLGNEPIKSNDNRINLHSDHQKDLEQHRPNQALAVEHDRFVFQ
ncbi:Cytochrome b561 domain-containing protein [Thalictrum thalictroides]|uniref:Cytochrome b561 domain-containing protein n=1 Tax=Thalictrum thalictroides TaxID=46969 RepID=A0A7J6WMB9_THATH|nr:Cytochrome b561 domain-containing protein [Thalictrum thalictroides]